MEANAQTDLISDDESGADSRSKVSIPRAPVLVDDRLCALLYALGILIPAVIFIDLFTRVDFFVVGDDPMVVTVNIAVAGILLIAPGAFRSQQRAYERLWERGVVKCPDDEGVASPVRNPGDSGAGDRAAITEYRAFVKRFERRANSRWGIASLSALAFVGANFVFWQEVEAETGETASLWFSAYETANGTPALVGAISQVLIWVMVGLIAWKVFWAALETTRFSNGFRFDIVVGHPDRSGGLGVMGEACFRLALMVVVPSLLAAFWVVVLDAEAPSAVYRSRYQAWAGNWRLALALLIVLTFLVAVRPVWGIHKGMLRDRQRFLSRVDAIASDLDDQMRTLLEQAREVDAEDLERRQRAIEAKKGVIAQAGSFPTWPFDRSTSLKLGASQVVPVLTLLGLTEPWAGLVEGLFDSLGS